jgi:hypothetical protein
MEPGIASQTGSTSPPVSAGCAGVSRSALSLLLTDGGDHHGRSNSRASRPGLLEPGSYDFRKMLFVWGIRPDAQGAPGHAC